jgi:hypothetical protein
MVQRFLATDEEKSWKWRGNPARGREKLFLHRPVGSFANFKFNLIMIARYDYGSFGITGHRHRAFTS